MEQLHSGDSTYFSGGAFRVRRFIELGAILAADLRFSVRSIERGSLICSWQLPDEGGMRLA